MKKIYIVMWTALEWFKSNNIENDSSFKLEFELAKTSIPCFNHNAYTDIVKAQEEINYRYTQILEQGESLGLTLIKKENYPLLQGLAEGYSIRFEELPFTIDISLQIFDLIE